ncbi:unnamed protein product [Adineta ricciae]|uniref:Uncharacterized protein n=1 Tax=Adineta ricciae TaxID=249248 RepID=A0A813PNX0_ADIRI|nr:unnamed protein product [Adineta ricciae]CAF1222483.1 unnamed protein product [Adineta ricciae]
MSNNESSSSLEMMSAALRAATKLAAENDQSAEITPEMLASAIKLAALSADKQEQLTPDNISAAIQAAKATTSNKVEERHQNLTPESLAIALKLATKAAANSGDDDDVDDDQTINPVLAAMKAAIIMTQKEQSNDLATAETLSNAHKLGKE